MATVPHERSQRLYRIGAVYRLLREEFPDISISKIRYLEGEGLLSPRRTRGGYRLFDEDDVERLETILRMQRDEFLPLRVIKEELDAARPIAQRRRRRAAQLVEAEREVDLAELCDRAGISTEFARQLEEFGLLEPRIEGGERLYREADVEIAEASGRLSRYGIDARHLRTFRTTADRQAALLEQLVAPALRSRSEERRREGLDDLKALGLAAQELAQLLLAER
jgi:DNA-binding transcriptional MerR regulator